MFDEDFFLDNITSNEKLEQDDNSSTNSSLSGAITATSDQLTDSTSPEILGSLITVCNGNNGNSDNNDIKERLNPKKEWNASKSVSFHDLNETELCSQHVKLHSEQRIKNENKN